MGVVNLRKLLKVDVFRGAFLKGWFMASKMASKNAPQKHLFLGILGGVEKNSFWEF